MAQARAAHRHNQAQCIEALVVFGARRVSQSTFSKWETGAVGKLDEETVRATERYWAESGLDLAGQVERALTDEPLLSERQARLVDGLAARLMEGSMTDSEVRLAQALMKSVGL